MRSLLEGLLERPSRAAAIVGIVLALLLLLGAWFAWQGTHIPVDTGPGAPPGTEPEEPPDARDALPPTPAETTAGDNGIHGRMLAPDGTPVRAAEVKLRWYADGAWRVARTRSGAGGRFSFPRSAGSGGEDPAQSTLTAIAEPWSQGHWSIGALRGGESGDRGDFVFQPPGTVVVRIAGPGGERLSRGWAVEGTPASPESETSGGAARRWVAASGVLDVDADEFVLSGLPAGRVKLEARFAGQVEIAARLVEVAAWEVTTAELAYAGTAIERRILVETHVRPFRTGPGEEHVRLRDASGAEIPSRRMDRSTSKYLFEGLDPDTYTVVIDDPYFEPWTQAGFSPGDHVHAHLDGSAALVLEVLDGDRGGAIESYELLAAIEISDWTPTQRTLLRAGASPPAGGVYKGFVPQATLLTVRAEGFAEWTSTLAPFAAGEQRKVVAELTRGKALFGELVASEGLPVADVGIELTRGERAGRSLGENPQRTRARGSVPPVEATTRTTASGTFAFELLAPGPWTVRAVWSPWVVTTETLTIERTDRSVTLAAPPVGFLTGTLLLPDAARLEDVELKLSAPRDGAGSPRLRGVLDRHTGLGQGGTFRAGPLPLARLHVQLSVLTNNPILSERSPLGSVSLDAITIESGENEHVFDLREIYPGRIRTTVRIDGELVPHGVRAVRLPRYTDRSWSGRGDGSGTYLIGGLSQGPWSVRYTPPDGTWTWTHPGPIEVVPGGETAVELDITLSRRSVRLVDRVGTPLPNERITWTAGPPSEYVERPGSTPLEAAHRTDVEGWLTLSLPVGSRVSLRTRFDEEAREFDWDDGAPEPLRITIETD